MLKANHCKYHQTIAVVFATVRRDKEQRNDVCFVYKHRKREQYEVVYTFGLAVDVFPLQSPSPTYPRNHLISQKVVFCRYALLRRKLSAVCTILNLC